MKVLELLKISMEILRLMSENDISLDDYRYVRAYEEFCNMRRNKVKYREAIRMLAEENHIGQRTLERVFKRIGKDCIFKV